jgi:hypothetical protein
MKKNSVVYYMKRFLFVIILLLNCLFFSGCATTAIADDTKKYKHHTTARITFWHRFEDKINGNRVAMCSKIRAKEGITVAARRNFAFGTSLFIPRIKKFVKYCSGVMQVQDRGKDVHRLKASHGKAEVFDVYIDAPNKKIAQQRLKYLEANAEPYMEVYY